MGDPFDALSPDLFRAVLLRCDNAGLVRAGCVSRRWRYVSREATVLAIYKNQRVCYINGRSRWDWDCILFHVEGSKLGIGESTPDASTKTPSCNGDNPTGHHRDPKTGDSSTSLESVLRSAPQKGSFRHIDLSHVHWEGPLSLTVHRNLEFAALPASCSSFSAKGCSLLRCIQVGSTGFESQLQNSGLLSATQIDLSGCRVLSNDSLARLFPGAHTFGRLSVLFLHHCHLLLDDTLADVIRRCPNLKKLGLTGIAGPATLGALATVSESRLEVLELAHSPKLGDSDALPLLAACPRLRRCNLRGCKGVSAAAYNAVAKEVYLRQAAEGVPVPSDFYYLKR